MDYSTTIALIFILSSRKGVCTILNVKEGEAVKLNFSYPCDSTKVTLQHGYKAPFYSSANPFILSLSPRYKLINNSGSDNDQFSCNLTINPVSRDDQGTYILTAYKDGHMLPDYPRIGLRVDYPPGKASCQPSAIYIEREWIALDCSASVGTLPGQIVCYQYDMRLPPLTVPDENGGTLSQKILARIANHAVYCCSSTLDQTKPICGCQDYGWDPIQNTAITNIKVPCSSQNLVQQPTKGSESVTTASNSQAVTVQTTSCTEKKKMSQYGCSVSWKYLFIGSCTCTCLFILMTIILAALLFSKVNENKTISNRLHDDTMAINPERQNLKPETPI